MRIVELLIENLEDELGVSEVALVNEPAIEVPFFAFNEDKVDDAITYQIIKLAMNELFVESLPGESKEDYLQRCIPVLKSEGYDDSQATAICHDTFQLKKKDTVDEFASYTDYPESATNAARRALEWRDSHPDNDCGTRVGWARANQLANRRPISEETIARMASFARHLQHEDVPYSEGCGGLMVDAWGGRAGIEWAQNKLEDIREEQSKDVFSFYDDLPVNVQDKLLERLSETGISLKKLQDQGWVVVKEEKLSKEDFALPSRIDSNPDKPTNDMRGQYKILYQYDVMAGKGPKIQSNTRKFCRRLINLDLLFRKEDIDRMTIKGANSEEFGYYNIFQYKGSYNCRHFWKKIYLYNKKEDDQGDIKSLQPQTIANIPSANVSIGVDSSIPDNDVQVAFKKTKFALDEDKRITVGPLMIPDRLIFRVDENDEPFYVYFSKDTIQKIANKLMKDKLVDKMNLEHDQDTPVDGYMLETWLIDDPENDKANIYGFDNLPQGTWMGMYKIEDENVWQMVKDGKVTGFSVEGYFADRAIQN